MLDIHKRSTLCKFVGAVWPKIALAPENITQPKPCKFGSSTPKSVVNAIESLDFQRLNIQALHLDFRVINAEMRLDRFVGEGRRGTLILEEIGTGGVSRLKAGGEEGAVGDRSDL
ncbi:hypothetical protein AVEN_47972-1 [Araneus ventricosus]|uniref:Uncharacterized protein n=1 Tax=Araneus ventricosus TaxID=182803 RepID=A0A4Y2JQI8_ARAVE|nr:hypothetical protein AVEN_47972-1 [Araneus ventricosus]